MTEPENDSTPAKRAPAHSFLDRQVQKMLAATDVTHSFFDPATGERRDEHRILREVIERETITASRTLDGAQSRAAELIAPAGSDTPFWATAATNLLATCLHAAATDGNTLDDVRTWLTSPERVITEVRARLGNSPAVAEITALERWADSNTATAAAITATAHSALERLHDAAAMPMFIDESAAIAPDALTDTPFATGTTTPEPVPVDSADYLRPVTQADLDQWPSNTTTPAVWNWLRDPNSPKDSR